MSTQNETPDDANTLLALSGQTKFTPEEVIDAIKTLWIKEYGNLNGNENERDGYFVCGFVNEALKVALRQPPVSGSLQVKKCKCLKCYPNEFPNIRFNVCQKCGNKRCPHATDHNYECTNSNEVGQIGSVYSGNDR